MKVIIVIAASWRVLAELNVIIYVRFSDRYLAKISFQKKKKIKLL